MVRDLRRTRARGVERKAERRQKGKLKVGVDIPTREEIKAIVEAAKGRWRPILLTAIFTGLRASELRGLRWADVDLDKRELHVRQRADRYSAIGKPKSEVRRADRSLNADRRQHAAGVEARLPEERGGARLSIDRRPGRASQEHRRARACPHAYRGGVAIEEKGPEGETVKRAKYTGLHALRHFYASWCINRRVDGGLELPAKVVQERLGHSSIMMTMDVYGHLFPRGDDSPSWRRQSGRCLHEKENLNILRW